jgi:hypothetical protein
MDATCFKIVSIGIVAENKAMQSNGGWNHVVDVTPIESMNMLDGEIKSNPSLVENKGVDRTGQQFGSSVAVDQTVSATWLPFSTNRVTSPDVRRGERVYLWQAANDDKYYWTIAGLDDDKRRLETVIYAFNANPSAGGLDLSNCYYLEVSAHNKSVTFETSTANGEAHAYTLQINTGESVITIQDDAGNYFQLDSDEQKLTLMNQAQSHVILDKTKINIKALDEVAIDVGATQVTLTPAGTIWKTPKFDGFS